jgi:hypothetical protein
LQKLIKAFLLISSLVFPTISFALEKPLPVIDDYLTTEVTDKSVARLILDVNSLLPGQVLVLHLDSPGGEVEAGFRLIQAEHNTLGKVLVLLDGRCDSMAVDIALAASDVEIGRAGQPGADNEVVIHQAYDMILFRTDDTIFMHKVFTGPGLDLIHAAQKAHYKGIITAQEQQFIFDQGHDFHLTSAQFVTRIHNHNLS